MKVKLAFLGVEHSHAPGKARAAVTNPEVALIGVYESDATVREMRASQEPFRDLPWCGSMEELLDQDDLAGVIVDGYVRHNFPLALAALRAGKHVLLEKPAGSRASDIAVLQKEAQERELHLQMGYHFRYMPAFRLVREAAAQGLLGDVFFFRGRISKKQDVYEELLPELRRYPGGNFFELGCHVLDMGIALMGAPKSVQSVLRSDYGIDRQFADNTVAVVEFGGGIGVFESAAMEVDPRRRIEIYGTQGSAILEPIMPEQVELCLNRACEGYKEGWQTVDVGRGPSFQGDIEEFVACILGRKEPEYPPEHERTTHETLMQICGEKL